MNGAFFDFLTPSTLRRSHNPLLINVCGLEFARSHELNPGEIHVVALPVQEVGRLEITVQVEDPTSNKAHVIETDEDHPVREQ